MPNHVRQRLTVVGSKDDVDAFVVTARGARPTTGDDPDQFHGPYKMKVEPLCFHVIAPLPDTYSAHPYGDRESVGYNLESKGWGVKWGPYDVDKESPRMSDDGTRATYDFTCAWGPPVMALRRASFRYPTLRMFLSWGGEGPCRGRHALERGEICVEIEDDYETEIAPDMPSDEEYEADERAASAKGDAAERKYIESHDAWVDEQIGGRALQALRPLALAPHSP